MFFAERSRRRREEASYGGQPVELSNNEKRMLKALRSRPTDIWTLDEVLTACQWDDQAYVAGSGLALAEHGLVDLSLIHI